MHKTHRILQRKEQSKNAVQSFYVSIQFINSIWLIQFSLPLAHFAPSSLPLLHFMLLQEGWILLYEIQCPPWVHATPLWYM